MSFLDEAFEKYNNIAIILDIVDDEDGSAYIQHFTGFSSKTVQYIANHYNKYLHSNFKDIECSGNTLYYLTHNE